MISEICWVKYTSTVPGRGGVIRAGGRESEWEEWEERHGADYFHFDEFTEIQFCYLPGINNRRFVFTVGEIPTVSKIEHIELLCGITNKIRITKNGSSDVRSLFSICRKRKSFQLVGCSTFLKFLFVSFSFVYWIFNIMRAWIM